LELKTPAHLGNGDVVGLTDMPLLRDAVDETKPLLTGASIAGALRSYVREYQQGYGAEEKPADRAEQLFGAIRGKVSRQSWLLIDDVLGVPAGTELRDGVAIDPQTRTAEEGRKYDTELLAAGTRFPLHLELLLTVDNMELLETLAIALRGLERGEIGLGLRKRRGLGECQVTEWRVRRYDLRTPVGLIAWLDDSHAGEKTGADICKLLDVSPALGDAREEFRMTVTCKLPGSLLIRSGSGGADSPDMVHLRSRRPGREKDEVPILSGTSLAGGLRARALRIANTVLPGGGSKLVDSMFGKRIGPSEDEPSGSRVVTYERELRGTQDWVQSRVKIDRFTGGSFPQALFSEQPAFGGDGASVEVNVALRGPREAEMGLLLLVLKDLWTGDLPLGGESSVGRGRLQGQRATLLLRGTVEKSWTLEQKGNALELSGTGTRQELEDYVTALHAYKEGQ
jgi:CRISPR/Cas system CSM-associated protein Csm3 (group 7 of RAMP superfamily)